MKIIHTADWHIGQTFFGYDRQGNFLSSQEVAQIIGDEGCGLTEALSSRVARIYE